VQAGTSFRTTLAAFACSCHGEAEIRNTEARLLLLSGGLCEEERVSSALDSEPCKTNFRVGARAGSRLYLHTLALAFSKSRTVDYQGASVGRGENTIPVLMGLWGLSVLSLIRDTHPIPILILARRFRVVQVQATRTRNMANR
jgi:hypothetical protein